MAPHRFARLDRVWDYLLARTHYLGAPASAAPRVKSRPLGVEALEERVVPARPLPYPVIATGPGQGGTQQVKLIDADTGATLLNLTPYAMSYTGGVRVAMADFTADGYPDLVTAPGAGGGPEVRVFDGKTGQQIPGPLGNFFAYASTFTGGVQLAAADVTGDGVPDVVTAADAGGGPHVEVFDGKTGAVVQSFFAFEPEFSGGVRVAARDLTGDGHADLIFGAGVGGAPRVRVLDGATMKPVAGPLGDFFAGDPATFGGVWVAAGDVTGDGRPDLVTGAGVGGPADVTAYDAVTGKVALTARAFDLPYTGGVKVGLAYVTDDAAEDIVVGTAAGLAGRIRVLDGATGAVTAGPAGDFDPGYGGGLGGVNLAAESDPVTLSVTATPASRVVAAGQRVAVRADLAAVPAMDGASVSYQWATGTKAAPAIYEVPVSGSAAAASIVAGTAYAAAGARTVTVAATASYLGDTAAAATTLQLRAVDLPAPEALPGAAAQLWPAAAGGGGGVPSAVSGSGVRYGDGVAVVSTSGYGDPGMIEKGLGDGRNVDPGMEEPDAGDGRGVDPGIVEGGPGFSGGALGGGDGWASDPAYSAGAAGGNGWAGTGASRLVASGPTLTVFGAAGGAVTLDGQGSPDAGGNYPSYLPRFADSVKVTYDSAGGRIVVAGLDGGATRYVAFSGAVNAGRFASYTEPGGTVTQVVGWDDLGRPTEVQRSATLGGTTVVDSLVTAYLAGNGPNAGRKSSDTLRRQVGGGAWQTVRATLYDYYAPSEAGGTTGDLKLATVKDAAGNVLGQRYYRYYDGSTSTGLAGQMRYAFGPAAYARLKAALGGTDGSVQTATDATVSPYADSYFEYDSSGRTARAATSAAAGADASSSTYAYTASGNAPGVNSWAVKTVETLADGNTNTVYTNAYGEVMLRAYRETATGQDWRTYYRYDPAGRLVLTAQPSAVTGRDEAKADLVNYVSGNAQYLSDASGLVSTTAYYSTTTATETAAGGVAGFVQSTAIRQGETGTAVPQSATTYFERVAGAAVNDIVASSTVYRNADGTGAETTKTAYTWKSGTAQVDQAVTTPPAVTTAENGPGAATSTAVAYDSRGRVSWTKDQSGFLTYTAYDPATGAASAAIDDVNTAMTGDFAGLPSGWATPSGGGLHLKTLYERDLLGRATKVTYPGGRVDYAVYNDPGHEVRSYAGWNAATGTPTGPTVLSREDRDGGYSESLTFSAAPAVSGGRPTGTELVASIQMLSRGYMNLAQQDVQDDAYYDLTGLTYSHAAGLGAEGTNLLRSRQGYDARGRLVRSQTPAGTVTRTVYDGQDRPVSSWVGTNDTPTSGAWSPSNPAGMVQVSATEYDGGGVGDSDATKVTAYPGLGATPRVTQAWYDWRDRTVAVKQGVEASESVAVNRPILYAQYDNLDEAVSSESYDGDGVSVTTTGGVPNRPSASLLRGKSTASFDELGRQYLVQTYSVDPASGSVGAYTLNVSIWYDARGNVAKTSSPGGLVRKTLYDGVGRATIAYITDGGGDSAYSDAGNVTGDAVLSQAETAYDADGNAILSTTLDRFHDETATGVLGTPTTGPKARVSFTTSYYDAADRLTDRVDVGTNGGTAYTRPGSAPARSDTALVSSLSYDAAGRGYETTDPRGIKSRTYYDLMGRVTKTVEDYIDGTPSNADDKTTEYTYGTAGVTSVTADLAGGGGETTQWVYGVTPAAGSAISSNDIVGATRWPDPSTGAASASQQDAAAVNALGETVTTADRNGTAHALSYDTLGRQTDDAVTALGTGIDAAVRRLHTDYDGQGDAYLLTSYSAATGGSVVNQVQRGYNGLGQLTAEYQAHGGAVDTAATPKVQYAYSEMAGGVNNSRPISTTYPNGRVVADDYGTAGGLNDRISRLGALKDGTTTLEGYTYLGLGTVVTRSHPEDGVNLTYVKLAGESNGDAGDQYTGLDRFGRVVDQRWLTVATGVAVDRTSYTYDRDGNRLTMSNALNSAFSETYTYDGLNQVSTFARGLHTQTWGYDALGNMTGVTTDGTTQSRISNMHNEITQVSAAVPPIYDAAGNMTGDEVGKLFSYDAWNRLVKVRDGSGAVLETIGYDAISRRVTTVTSSANDIYYSAMSQVLEERVSGVVRSSYVWSPVYVDALITRDRDLDGSAANGLEERMYATQNGNWNTTSIVSTNGTVAERYAYDAFGALNVLDATFETKITGTGYAWQVLFQGMRYDALVGLSYQRARWYSPTLERWVSLDPLTFASGDVNFYRMEANDTTVMLDPLGLSGAANHHPYPVMLGGSDSSQPLFQFTEEQHNAAEAVFKKYGYHNHNNRALNDAARAKWAALTPAQQEAIIEESLRAAKVPDTLIKGNMKKIVAGSTPGQYVKALNRVGTHKNGGLITKAVMDEAANIAKAATALGGILIMGGVGYANDTYVATGEEGGNKIANKIGLITTLRLAINGDDVKLPTNTFFIKWRDGTVMIRTETFQGSKWLVVYQVELDDNGIIKKAETLIKPGECPRDK